MSNPQETTHDFNDSNGPVPAHRHANGGGWVDDTAAVARTAYVGRHARVFGNAQVFGNAWVRKTRDYLTIGPIGSRNAAITFFKTKDGVMAATGCFMGDLDAFAAAVEKTHGDNEHGHEYRAALALARVRFGVEA